MYLQEWCGAHWHELSRERRREMRVVHPRVDAQLPEKQVCLYVSTSGASNRA